MINHPVGFTRKQPTQARAQATMESILRAAAHILKTKGYAACSTNAVAKKAGVSIGSLYQYFPSKEALVAALAEQHAQEGYELLLESVREAMAKTRSLEDSVRHAIGAMVRLHSADPDFHRVLIEQLASNPSGLHAVRRLSNQSAALVRTWLEAHQDQLRPLDLDAATYVLVTSVEAVTHLRLVDRPAHVDTEALVRELSELVLRYVGIVPKTSR